MRTIHKYPLDALGENVVEIPKDAGVIHVACQRLGLHIWAIIDTEQPLMRRRFFVAGTGHDMAEMPYLAQHIGTAQIETDMMWHVFDGWYLPQPVIDHTGAKHE